LLSRYDIGNQRYYIFIIRPTAAKYGNINYYQPDKSVVLIPENITIVAKCAGIEPKVAFNNLFIQIAYNQQHQEAVVDQVSEFIKSRKGEIKLLAVNNLTKFFRTTPQIF